MALWLPDHIDTDVLDVIAGHLLWLEEVVDEIADPEMAKYRDYDSLEEAVEKATKLGKWYNESDEPHNGDCICVPMTCTRCLVEYYRETAFEWYWQYTQGTKLKWAKCERCGACIQMVPKDGPDDLPCHCENEEHCKRRLHKER